MAHSFHSILHKIDFVGKTWNHEIIKAKGFHDFQAKENEYTQFSAYRYSLLPLCLSVASMCHLVDHNKHRTLSLSCG